jgi:4-diphosphocytidyl-2-C-methyl-D-erythritol kinase
MKIRPARPDEVPHLTNIESRAGALFVGLIEAEVAASCVDPRELDGAVAEGRVLVAVDDDDRAQGFAYLMVVLGEAHLEELDVVPEHGRRGVGAALVEAACQWARARGHATLSLSTYRDIPWNAPFYARRGFAQVAESDFTAAHLHTFERERRKGYDMPRRTLMVRRVG